MSGDERIRRLDFSFSSCFQPLRFPMPHKTFAQKLASVLKTSPFGKISAKPRKPRPLPRRLLQFESLEERQLLTVAHAVATDGLAAEGQNPDYGTFNIQLDEAAVSPVTVNFQLSGTAVSYTLNDCTLYKSNGQIDLTPFYDNNLDAYVWQGSVVIAANQSSVALQLRPKNDSLLEETETAVLTLLPGNGYTVDLASDTATVFIQDNDQWRVNAVKISDGAETSSGSQNAVFRVSRTGETDTTKALTVYFRLSGSAQYGTSYDFTLSGGSYDASAGYGSLTISSGQTYKDITCSIKNDALKEDSEAIKLILIDKAPDSTDPAPYILGADRTATASITDNDQWTVSASVTQHGIEKSSNPRQPVIFTVERSGESDKSRALTVYYILSGTADLGSDYSADQPNSVWDSYGQVTIPANQSSATVKFNVTDDYLIEDTEQVVLTILDYRPSVFTSDPDVQYSVGATASAAAQISDNEIHQTVSVEALSPTAAETNSGETSRPAEFRISRTGSDLSGALSVSFQLSGTASGSDYQFLASTVTIPAGSSYVDLAIPIINDNTVESAEELTIQIIDRTANSTNPPYQIGELSSATVIVQDNDAPATLNILSSYSVGVGEQLELSAEITHDPYGTGAWTVAWDLDADGVYGETGSGALRGDEAGPGITFDSAGLSKGQSAVISLRAFNGTNTVTQTSAVTVVNTVPQASFTLPILGLTGTAVAASGSFTDPDSDIWTGTVDYGDGTAPASISIAQDKTFSFNHNYAAPGKYTVTVRISDGEETAAATRDIYIAAPPTGGLGTADYVCIADNPSFDLALSGDTLTLSSGVRPGESVFFGIWILNRSGSAVTLDLENAVLPNNVSWLWNPEPEIGANGAVYAVLEWKAYESLSGTLTIPIGQQSFQLSLSGTVDALQNAPVLSPLLLVKDTGDNSSDKVTYNPMVKGTVTGNFGGGYVTVEFDHNNDGTAEGSQTVHFNGMSFVYDPREFDDSWPEILSGNNQNVTLKYRLVHYRHDGTTFSTGSWQPFDYTICPIDLTSNGIAGVQFVKGYGGQWPEDGAVKMTGTASGASHVEIRIYNSNNIQVSRIVTAVSGNQFSAYLPGLEIGSSYTVKTRSLTDNTAACMELPGAWDVRTVTPSLPAVATFGLVTDDGDNSSDGQSSVLTLEGTLTGIGKEYCEVEFFCGNISLGSAWTDENGAFEFEPTGLLVSNGVAAGTVTAKAVYRPAQGNPVYGTAASQTITYVPPASNSKLTVSLVNPLASNSNATSSPEISVIGRFDDDKLVRYEFQWKTASGNWSNSETVAASAVEGSEILDTIQQESTFRLQYLSDLTGTSNGISLRVRPLVYDPVLAGYRADSDDWTALGFTYVKPAYLTGGGNQNTGPFTLTILTPADNGTATDLTLSGTVASDTEDVSCLAVSVYSVAGGISTLLGITETDEDGCFEFRPSGLTAGTITFRAEYTYYDVNEYEYIDVSDTVSFTYTAPAVSAGVVSELALLDDTGTAGDSVTNHADLTGRLADDGGNLYRVVIEIDTDADGIADDYSYTDENGEFLYRYTPATSGNKIVQARAVRWDAFSGSTVTGGWKSLRFTYNAPAQADLPVFTQFGPASAVEGANDVLVASSPVVTGAVSAPCSFTDVSVEVKLSGGTAVPLTLNERGEFCWLPDLVTTGNETTVTVQGRLGRTVLGTTVWGDWTTVSFVYRTTPESEILYYDLKADTASGEENTYSLSGQLVRATDAESVYLEIDSCGGEQADLRLYANSEGYFSGTVTIDRPTVRVRVVDRSSIGIDTPTQDGWNSWTVASSGITVDNTRLTVAYENGEAVVRVVGHQGTYTGVSVLFDVDSDGTHDFSLPPDAAGEIDSARVLSGLQNYLRTHSDLKSSGLVLLNAWIGELTDETQTVIVPVVVSDGLSADQLLDVTSQYGDFAAAWGGCDQAQQTATAAQTPITVQSTEETPQAVRPGSLFNPDDWNILLSTPIPDIVSPAIFGETLDLENSEMLADDLEDYDRFLQDYIANAQKVYITSYETLIQNYNDALDRAWNEYSAAYDRLQNQFDEVQARTWESTEISRKLNSEYTAAQQSADDQHSADRTKAEQQAQGNILLLDSLYITCKADYFKALYLAFEHYQSALATAKHQWEVDQANELKSITQEMAGLKKTYEDACSDAIDILKGDGSSTGIGAVNYNYCNSVITAWYRATIWTIGSVRSELNAWKNAEGTETDWANFLIALNQHGHAEEANVISSYYTYCMTSANAMRSSISTELNALKSYESSNALSSYYYEMADINATAAFQIASANAELSYLLNAYSQIKSVGYYQIDCSHAAQQTILQAESAYSGAQLKSIVINSAEQMYLGVINSGEQLLQSIIRGRGDCERSVYDSYGVYLKAVAAAEVAQDYAKATADYTLTAAYNGAEQSARTASETALETYLQYSLDLSETTRAQEYSDLFDRVSDELPGWFQSTISAYGNLGNAAGDLYESIYSLISSNSAADLTAGEALNDSLISQGADYAESILNMNLTFNSAVSAAVDQYKGTVNAVPTQGSTSLSYAQIDAEIQYYKDLETVRGSEALANVTSIYQYYRNNLQCNVLLAEYGYYSGISRSIIHSTCYFTDRMVFPDGLPYFANITEYVSSLNISVNTPFQTTQICDFIGRYYPDGSSTPYFAGISIPSYSQLGMTQDQYSAMMYSPHDLLRAELIQASFARHAAEADAELTFLNAYGTSARTEIVNSFSETRSDLNAQIAAGRTLNNSLWSLAQTANGTYTAAIQDDTSSEDIRAYLESSDNDDIDFEADLEGALGDFQVNWRQDRLSGMQQNDPYYTVYSDDLAYITQTNAARNSYNSAMALKSKALNSTYYTAMSAYESSLLGAAITQNNAILDAAETRDKGRYSAEADYYDAVLDAQEDWTLAQFDALLEEMVNNATAEKAIYGSYAQACAAALNSVGPIYGSGTDLLAYFSVHSNPYAAIVSEFSGSVETEIENAHSANAADREEADEASRLAYEVADNAAYAAYVTALAQLETAYQTAVSAANAAFNTAAETAESVYTMTVTPALHQYEQDYEYLTSLYSQAVKIIEDGGTVSATYLTDDTISFTVCFVAGTPVLLADGTVKPIEEVRPGDMVLAADHLNPGEAESAEVIRVFDNGFKTVVRLVFDCQTVVCTPEHPFFVPGKGWKTASELERGDQCVSADGGKILFERREEIAEPQRVYNFEVGGKHTYYVGTTLTDSVLVHNVCSSCGASDCPGPKKGWHPFRWLYTGDIHACDNLMNGSLEAAGEVVYEKAPEKRKWFEALSIIDPTPISDALVSFMYLAEGEDEKAKTAFKVGVLGLGVGGTGSVHLAGAARATVKNTVQKGGKAAKVAQKATQGVGKAAARKQAVNKTSLNQSVKEQRVPCKGQNHHGIAKKPFKAIVEKSKEFAEQLKIPYRKFTTQALDLVSHRGYERWHRELDALLVKLINKVPDGELNGKALIKILKKVYSNKDLRERFPNFFADLKEWIQKYGIDKMG